MAFKLLCNIYMSIPMAVLSPNISLLFTLIFRRVGENKTTRFCKLLTHSFCVFIMINGAAVLFEIFGQMDPSGGLMRNFIQQLWGPNAAICAAADVTEVNQMIVGGSKLLCEVGSRDQGLFVYLLKAVLPLLQQEGTADAATEIMLEALLEEGAENREFDATYSKLAFSQIPEPTSPPEVKMSHSFFANALSSLCRASPGVFVGMMQSQLSPGELATVQTVCSQAGQSLI